MSILQSYNDDEFIRIVETSNSYREVAKKLGYHAFSGPLCKMLKARIDMLHISTDHFGKNDKKIKRNRDNVFCENSTASQKTLKEFFLKEKPNTYACNICGIKHWRKKPIVLILDHINGINNDNRLCNLRWVCPNCNSQLETFAGRNIRNKKPTPYRYCIDCGKLISKNATRCNSCNHKTNPKVTKEKLQQMIEKYPNTKIAELLHVSDTTIKNWRKKYNI